MEDFSVAVAAVAAAAAAADPKPQSPYIALMMNQSAKSGEAEAPTLAVSGNDSAASALSEQTSSLQPDLTSHNCNPRKRKCPPKNKEGAENDRKEKCCNNGESTKEKDGNKAKTKDRNGSDTAESCLQQAADANATSAPPPKQDYIHVRARRGQATDSHSLAERVRREKISERMKILQDLVPGCNKITGKAVMLDEIINYVQALQRQVEFLSMKLAAVNPHPDSDLGGNYLAKDILQPHCTSALFVPNQYQHPQKFASEQSMQCKVDEHAISEAAVRRMMDAQFHCINGQSETMFQNLQMLHFWDNEFQNGMDPRTYNHSKSTPLTSHSFQGLLSTAHMKVEL